MLRDATSELLNVNDFIRQAFSTEAAEKAEQERATGGAKHNIKTGNLPLLCNITKQAKCAFIWYSIISIILVYTVQCTVLLYLYLSRILVIEW